MNHIYRLVWNTVLNAWVAVAETVRGRGKAGSCKAAADRFASHGDGSTLAADGAFALRVSILALSLALIGLPQGYAANAVDASVVAGSGTVTTVGSQTTINQSSQRLALDWSQLSTVSGESLVFVQPNANAIALNRITGSSPSTFLGSLTANGQVFILNPNGVLFGAGSSVDVGGLVASTLSMSNADFMAGNHVFANNGASGSVVNKGTLSAAAGGYLALLAPEVRNEGVVTASLGTALLAAGNKVTLQIDNGSLLGYSIDQGALLALAENKQLIQANGGQVILSAKALDALTTATVNNTGVIEATTIGTQNGRILLLGDMQQGEVNAAGTLKAKFVETSAAQVNIDKDLKVDTQGGKWLIDPTDITVDSSNVAAYLAALGTGDVEITTASAGTDAGNIAINAAMDWASSSMLTLTADHDIAINAAINATNGGLTLNAGGTITAPAAVSIGGTFNLASGNWVQNAATLPSFYANDFQLNGGSFLRVTGGDGTSAATAYQLADAYGLQGLSSSLAPYWTLANDIDASGTALWNNGTGFKPRATFGGTLDGNGHTISGLTILSAGNTGLFNTIVSGGTVKNLNLFDATMTGVGAGGVLAVESNGTVSNVHVSGTLAGSSVIAGLVGHNAGTITASGAAVAVTGNGDRVGGLVGWNTGTIDSSYATGAVSGSSSVGGLVGWNDSTLTRSYATGAISGSDQVGGLVGFNFYHGTITQAYATGAVSGSTNVGGLVGYNSNGAITQSYAAGAVSGYSSVGGLVGLNDGTLTRSYATGAVSGSSTYVGGLVGYNFGMITQAYWDTQTSGLGVGVGVDEAFQPRGVTGLTTRQLQGLDPVDGYLFSLVNALGDGTISAFSGGQNGLYPYLTSFFPNGVQAVSGFAYSDGGATPLASGAAGAVTIALNADGSRIGQATTGANGYYYIVSPIGAPTVSSGGYPVPAINNGQNLLAFTTGSAPAAATLTTASGSSVQTGVNLYGNALTVNTAATLFSQAPQNATEARAQNAAALATAAGNDAAATAAIDGSVGLGLLASGDSFTIDQTPAINGVLAIQTFSPIIVNAPITVASGGLGLLSQGALTINAPINVNGAGSVALAYDASSLANLSFGLTGTGFTGSVTYLDGNGQPITSDAGGKLSINSNAYTLVYTMAQLDAIDGKEAVGNAVVAIYGSGLSGNYALARGLDASGVTYTDAIVAGQNGTQRFSGTLEGLGHTVANLTISGGNSYVGLIGSSNGTVRDIGVVGGSVSGSAYVGGLVGFNQTGLVGYGYNQIGAITQSYATGAVSGTTLVGGLVGYNYSGTVTRSYAAGAVSGTTDVGGLVGANEVGTITQSYAAGAVSGSTNVGGLAGANFGTITQSYATGAVSGSTNVGGLVGYNSNGVITQSYAAGAVSGYSSVGGLVGANFGAITQAYWDTQTSWLGAGIGSDNTNQSGNVAGLTTAQMNNPTNFINAGWDYSSVWGTLKTGGAPILRAFTTDPVYTYYVTLSGNTSTTYGDGITSTSGITVGGRDAGNVSVAWGSAIGATTNAGTYGYGGSNVLSLSYSAGVAGDYYVDYGTDSLTINKRVLSLTGSRIYDGSSDLAASIFSLSNLVNGDTLSLSGTGTMSDKNVGTGKTVTLGSLALDDATGLAANYTLVGGTNTVDIDKATITAITGITASNKTYDGTTSATLDTASAAYTGMAAGDVLTLATSTGAFSDKNAATGKTVNISGLSLSGTDAGNYTLAATTATTIADIAKAALTVTANTVTKTYDGTLSATGTGTVGTLAGADDVVNSSGSQAFTDKNAGTGKTVQASGVTIKDANGADMSDNYAITYVDNTTSIIDKANLSVSTSAVTKTYDGTTAADGAAVVASGTLFTGDSLMGGTFTFDDKNAGTSKTVSTAGVTVGDGTNNSNYNVTYVDNTASVINKAALTVTANTVTKTYDGTLSATGTGTVGTLAGAAAGDVVDSAGSQAFTDKNAGTGKTVQASGVTIKDANGADMSDNYAITYVDNTASVINKAALTVTANAVTKTYDGTLSATGTGTVGTLAGAGDVVNASGSQAFTDKNAGTGKTVQASGVTIKDANGDDMSGNYAITYVDNTASVINKAALTVTANAVTKTYDGALTAAGSGTVGTLAGAAAGDEVDSAGLQAFTDKNAGTGKTVQASGVTIKDTNGADMSDNYAITYVDNTASVIDKANLAVSTSAVTKTYDGTTAASGTAVVASGTLFTGDTLTGGSFAFSDKNAGTGKTVSTSGVTVGDGTNNSNYNVTYVDNTTSVIDKAALTVTANAVTKTYDGALTATGSGTVGTLAGAAAGDAVDSSGSQAFTDKNAGTGKTVQASGVTIKDANGDDMSGNYAITYVDNTTSIIDKANLSVSTSVVTKTYDGTTAASGTAVVASGTLFTGDTLTGGTFTFDDKNAGTGKTVSTSGVTVGDGTNNANYNVTYVDNTTSVIDKAALTVTANTVTKTYDGTLSATGTGTVGTLAGAGDTVDSAGSQAFIDKNAGTGKTVQASGVTIKDANGDDMSGNYAITYVDNTTSMIDKANLAVSTSAVTKTYDGTTAASGIAVVSSGTLFTGDTLSGGTFTFDDKNAGTGKTVLTSGVTVGDGTNNANYNVTYVDNTTSVIDKAALTVTANAVTKTYDGTLSATGTGTVGTLAGVGDVVNSSGSQAFIDKNSGTGKTVQASGVTIKDANGDDMSGNYAITYVADTANVIHQAVLNVTTTAADKVYDGTTVASALFADDRITGDALTITATASFADKDVGSGKTVSVSGIQIGGTDAGNYTLQSTSAATTASITPKSLVITANNDSRFAGGTAYSGGNGVQYSGFVSGEGASVLQGALTYGGSAQGASVAGRYAITPGGYLNGNYAISYVDGVLDIRQASAAASALGGPTLETAYVGTLQFVLRTDWPQQEMNIEQMLRDAIAAADAVKRDIAAIADPHP